VFIKESTPVKLLENKVALVTGAARGIGRTIAEVYAQQGAHVVVSDIIGDGARAVADDINTADSPKAIAIHLDVTDPDNVQRAIDQTVAEFGRIDVLVNNAAILRAHYIIDFPLQDWQTIFRVNMEGTFLCSQAAARQMIGQGQGGCIINISSAAANKADPKHAAYSASKAAIVCFTRILALELGEYGIRANAILPGATETEMLKGVFEGVPGFREVLIGRTTLGKLATPRDQANAALFLASDLASHITGEYLVVAGGEFMNA
jgi:NAD(P)-dependent dehydrogenase (short-subunit alcohol dehydrogenase family)